jgi:hypothetical protein
MILSRHLQELLNFKAPSPAVASLYLDLDAGRPAISVWRSLRKAPAPTGLSTEDLAALERAVLEHRSRGERALAVFSSERFGLFRVCGLPQPVKTRLVVGHTPSLAPFLNLCEQYQRYGVAHVSSEQARFMEFFMGQSRDLREQTIHARDFAGGRPAFMKAVSVRLQTLSRQLGFQRLILGAEDSIERELQEHLPRQLQDNLILQKELAVELSLEDTHRVISVQDDQSRRLRELVTAHRLLDQRGPLIAVGLNRPLLDAVEQGRVRTMIVRDGFAKLGHLCRGCRRLSLTEPKCVLCGAHTDTVFNLIEEIMDRAVYHGAEVYRLFNQTPLDNVGHIAAELRDPNAAARELPTVAAVQPAAPKITPPQRVA